MTAFALPCCPRCGTAVLPSERGVVRWLTLGGWWYLVTVHAVCDG